MIGATSSSDFPITADAFDQSISSIDAFVTKLNATGSALLYSTLLGGSFGAEGYDIAVHASGSIYVTGSTSSDDIPTTVGAFDQSKNGPPDDPNSSDAFVAKFAFVIEVVIDIKPGSDPNCINLGSEGVVPVAILGSTAFDVTTVDQTTLEPEGSHARVKGKSGNIGSFEDVSTDGFVDLVVQFPVNELDLTESDVEATLMGTLLDGTPIEGTDDICIVPTSASKNSLNSGKENLPKVYVLAQNYPNPFSANGTCGNPETEIRFQLPKAGQVMVKIFNTVGEEIRTLVDAQYEAGYHRVRWDGKDKNGNPVASGVYLYQLRAGSFSQVRKMSLLR